MSIYDGLNKEQAEAVQHNEGPLLILAGAGSGKTRVLTHRIAYLIDEIGINPWHILALTFTNKAAKEMRERVDQIVGYGAEQIWVSTFHSTCVRILRRYIDRLGYDNNFTIYDSDDQKSLMRDILKYLQLDPKKFKEKTVLGKISAAKNSYISPEAYALAAGNDYLHKTYAACYTEYQKRLFQNNALDFDDLLFQTVALLQNDKEVLTYYQKRFQYIMVDEYQDTNEVQFKLLHLLAPTTTPEGEIVHNLCVVGDDDQSIYRFRGANIYNILHFEEAYPGTKTIRLEQNYRSTQTILNAANEVIANNTERKEKKLWTENGEGEPLTFTQFDTAYEEAEAIANEIYQACESGFHNYKEYALLYRTNAQSRILEEKLVQRNIPYKLVGGVNFYQRKEIKDVLSYLRTINNGCDDISVKRIINVPKRGIGLTTIDRLFDFALNQEISFYEACKRAEQIPGIGRGASKVSPFVSMIEILKGKLSNPTYSLTDLFDEVLEATGYVEDLEAEDTDEARGRIENIDELRNKLVAFEDNAEEEPSLNAFLEEVSLVADLDSLDENTNVVTLMTLHSAKGLEFPNVYICGMEDGIFPGYMSITSDDPMDLEEERRLCYVGITRAMQHLFLTSARQRMQNGEIRFNKPSRFIHEIPRYLIKQKNTASVYQSAGAFSRQDSSFSAQPKKDMPFQFTNAKGNQTTYHTAASNFDKSNKANPFANNPYIQKGFRFEKPHLSVSPKAAKTLEAPDYVVGDRVAHSKFGVGQVKELNKNTKDYVVTVEFENGDTKKMMAGFAKLKKL
ncbi:MAG: UvrD-helicase domain-containing protein [Lachnospiraceae bacterium]|nr:UvrD-helicase domain-containing protein [Lachnospiraceae bacterium]